MKFRILFILIIFSAWVLAQSDDNSLESHLDYLQSQLDKAKEVKGLTEEAVHEKMKEMSRDLSSENLNQLKQEMEDVIQSQ